jgi:enoyl-CoA hydratase/carnithine racemase
MSQPGTISLERPAPKIATITFSNPPVNLVIGETVTRLHQLVAELGDDPAVQVVVFKSGVPGFFLNHFDLAAAADFPVPEGNDAVPVWTDVVLRLTKAPYITIASIRGRTRGGGNELALACDLRYASREKAMFGQPEVGGGLLPGGGGTERLPRFAGRDRALEIILSSSDYDAGLAERWGWVTRTLPDADSTTSWTRWRPAWPPSTRSPWRPPSRWSTVRRCRRTPTWSRPTVSSPTH